VAVAVNVYADSSGVVAVAGTPLIAGNVFSSVTVSVIAASVLAVPSLTRTVNGYAPGPCASLGVQLKAPVLALIAAPGGAPTRENVSACAGRSPSVAVAVNVYALSSEIVAFAGTSAIAGATFDSVTSSVIVASVFVAPSETRTVNG
jgi:hypothetical protein